MSRLALEVADIFRAQGKAWRQAHAGHISLGQLKVMSSIESCRSAALGGHVLRCSSCEHQQIAYNSCRNRHCPRCQGGAAHRWLEAHQADLLPVEYYHLVFTLPAPISDLGFSNKSVIYAILFKAAAATVQTIAADPRHLGAQVGLTLVLHTWGSAMTLKTDEFIRRFLIHVLPDGFHRIRHYGLLANARRRDNLKQARKLLMEQTDDDEAIENSVIECAASATNEVPEPLSATYLCPDCGSPMVIIECFERGQLPRAPPVRIIAA